MMRFFFVMIGLALVLAALSGMALAWNSGYELFVLLDTQAPLEPSTQRHLLTLPAQQAVLLLSGAPGNLLLSQTIYGLGYVVYPFLAMAMAWWLAREEAPGLFVWPAIGIGLVTIPGQLYLSADALIGVQLFWVLVIAMLVKVKRRQLPFVLLFAVVTFLVYPFTPAIAAAAMLLTVLAGLLHHDRWRRMALWGVGFVALALLAAWYFEDLAASQPAALTEDMLTEGFQTSLMGAPLIMLLSVMVASIALNVAPRLRQSQNPELALVAYVVELAGFVVAGLVMLLWALLPDAWEGTIAYRGWVLFCSLPFMAAAVFDSHARQRVPADWALEDAHRNRTVAVVGVICAVVLAVQGLGWVGLAGRLQDTLAESVEPAIPAATLDWLEGTPLTHWSVTAYSILLQGDDADAVVLYDDYPDLGRAGFEDGLYIADWYWRSWSEGAFDLSRLAERLERFESRWGGAWTQ
jgi:hypothetical protein